MLLLILQILVLVCSFSDQHVDPPESCHPPVPPKLCVDVVSWQTHPECVAAARP